MDEDTTRVSNERLEKLSKDLGQYTRPDLVYPLPGNFSSDEDATDSNYTEVLVRHARINPALIDRICELYLRDRHNLNKNK